MTLKPPEETEADALHALTKAGISLIPWAGAAAAEIFQWAVQPPLERRRDKWMQEVGATLLWLKDNQRINLEELGQNEQFVSAVMHASTIALRTHKDEKREALRNALINVALEQSPEEALQHMFFEWIDTFSVRHLQMLKESANPPQPRAGFQTVVEPPRPPQQGLKGAVDDVVWKDLHLRGLVYADHKREFQQDITRLGVEFLNFISEQE